MNPTILARADEALCPACSRKVPPREYSLVEPAGTWSQYCRRCIDDAGLGRLDDFLDALARITTYANVQLPPELLTAFEDAAAAGRDIATGNIR